MTDPRALPSNMALTEEDPMELGTPKESTPIPVKNTQRRIVYEDESPIPSPSKSSDSGISDVSTSLLSSLLKKPLKMCTSSDSVSPGRENAIMRRAIGVRGLQFDSPLSSRVETFKRPMEELEASPTDAKKAKALTLGGAVRPITLHMLNSECTPPNRKTRNEIEDVCSGNAERHIAAKKLPALKAAAASVTASPTTMLNRALSESHISIMKAVEGFGNNPNLIGDGSKCYSLPIEGGQHKDLKEISSDTMAALLRGEFTSSISGFEVVDCRYPYEYLGGHIGGAVNIHTQTQLFERYLSNKGPIVPGVQTKPGFILIFHCEYSSQRGPEMCRFLRDADRNVNMISYPAIYYPEVYLLAGGYKRFFETHQELCTPQTYVSMFDPTHAIEMKFYRSKSKASLVKTKSSCQLPPPPEFSNPVKNSNSCFKKLDL